MGLKRILFVDDEPMILQGLQRMLRPMRDQWEMSFVEGGEKALAAMAAQAYDVIVTDMRMPAMNGAQLLREVRDRHPRTVRLVLSGHADQDLVTQCLGVAHQYLNKPCDPEQLKTMIRNACLIGGDLVTGKVKEVLGSIDRLPTVPAVFRHLERALAEPEVQARRLGEIIEQDPGMTAKILKIVNSAFFGLRRSISTPLEAVTYLGTDTIKGLVLVNAIFERAEPLATRYLSLGDLWRHTLVTAGAAKAIALAEGCDRTRAEEVYVGGVLEDVGILVLASNFPEEYDRAAEVLLADRNFLTTVEQEEFGVTHAEVGAYLLGLWGLPAPILRIVSLHHSPHLLPKPGFGPEIAIYAADLLVGERDGNPLFRTGRFDLKTMARLGLAERLESWRSLVRDRWTDLDGGLHG
jgi:HD-like signal output (HDOD) protein/CheY-like chemotaxis protein